MTHVNGRSIILLEGLDKTGKTTTAGELAAQLSSFGPVSLVHFGKPQGEDQFRQYLEALRQADEFQGSTIIDRLHWSEEAYGRVYRDSAMSNVANCLDTVLHRIGGAVVLKRRPVAEIYHVLDGHDQTSKDSPVAITLKDIQSLTDIFNSRYHSTLVPSIYVPFKQAVPGFFLAIAAKSRTKSIERRDKK